MMMMLLLQIRLMLLVSVCLFMVGFASGQQPQPVLPVDEVQSLWAIARTLGKSDWDFSVDSCNGSSGWSTPSSYSIWDPDNGVTCNCTFNNNTVCHVVSIVLRYQNLSGSVPPELSRLPFLQEIDLSGNYLNGTIPVEWGSMKLVNISLIGNRVTGRIPKELGNISTLANLTVEYNQLYGTIPPELGNLSSIKRLVFMSNYLSGAIPPELAKLTTLEDFRISDNDFTGRIPDFLENWKNIERLQIQGSGLAGPIPLGIASLTNLTDLRISDLSGDGSTFPPLRNIKNLKNLILRSCNISGQLPDYISGMTELRILDLSFNKLSGPIPETFSQLAKTNRIFLTGNSLSGPVPTWMLSEGGNIDLSYNNFTNDPSTPNICQPRKLNLFASSKGNTTGIVSCLRSSICDRNRTSLHINCGGKGGTYGGIVYEDDLTSGTPAQFVPHSNKWWGYSNTGSFIDDDRPIDTFIWPTNTTISNPNFQLYSDARISPLSLTYYAFCLINGNYTVDLYFAEIMFTNDNTFSSLGRRIFDVYIQGKLVLKDFNIANVAGGVHVGIKESFTAIVDDGTLDIRFYWAGKGTNGIPYRGVYGPLISAISINSGKGNNSLSTGAIVGIVVGSLFAIILILAILWWRGCLGCKDTLMNDLRGLDLHTAMFSLRQIKTATNDFDPVNKIGEGGFGPVYKGILSDGTIIAVKQLSAKSTQGNREFINEIGMISALQHPHLVKLYGCCIEGNQLLLVYEYMENNSLARALFGPEEHQLHLNWRKRHKICIGIARGLAYLHEESRLKIVHRDIKATNVLLDKDLVPKISDFGIAKLDEEDNTHISTRVTGTFGYMAPEYAMRGHLTDKADVYSFGVVLLEVVCGRSNTSINTKDAPFYLLDWAKSLKEKGNLLELVDPRLESNYNKKEVMTAIDLALLCTNVVATERPSMSTVVSILEGKNYSGFNLVSDSSISKDKMNPKDISTGHDEVELVSMDVVWTGTSSSASDLYPILLDTDYWLKRG